MAKRRQYEKFMVHQGLMRDPKIRRFLDPEFRAFAACLCLASQSPKRGELLVSLDEPLTAQEVADEAGGGVTPEIAQDAIDKMIALGTLLVIDEKTGALSFGNWDYYNPKQKPSDAPEAAAERQRRKREKDKQAEEAARREAEGIGQAAQLVMDDDRSAPIRALADPDPLAVICPRCCVSPGQRCVTHRGDEKTRPHRDRVDKASETDSDGAFYRSERGGHLTAPLAADAPVADVEGWAPVLAALADRIPDFKAHIWIRPLELVGREANTLYVRAPAHLVTSVRDRFATVICEAASEALGETVAVEIVDDLWRPRERAA